VPARRFLVQLAFRLRAGPLRYSCHFVNDQSMLENLACETFCRKAPLGVQVVQGKLFRSRLLRTRRQVRALARKRRIVLDNY
jgi:hypothetical protein